MIYTKEPWEIRKNTSNTYILAKDGNGNTVTIASVFPRGIAGCEAEGNAYLMKVAPKMAKALKGIRDFLVEYRRVVNERSNWPILNEMNEALAEVEGKGEEDVLSV